MRDGAINSICAQVLDKEGCTKAGLLPRMRRIKVKGLFYYFTNERLPLSLQSREHRNVMMPNVGMYVNC